MRTKKHITMWACATEDGYYVCERCHLDGSPSRPELSLRKFGDSKITDVMMFSEKEFAARKCEEYNSLVTMEDKRVKVVKVKLFQQCNEIR